MNPAFTIDGRPVLVSDWTADAVVDWGPRNFEGTCPRSCTWARQGSVLQAWVGDHLLWAGKLSNEPRPDEAVLRIRAEGYAADIDADSTRMFYRIDGADEWVNEDSDPHNYVANEKFDTDTNPGALIARWGSGDAGIGFANGNQNGWVLWVEGGLIKGYSVLTDVEASLASFDFEVHRAQGPAGSLTLINTHSLAIGAPTTRSATLTQTTDDMLVFRVRANSAVASTARHRLKLSAIKVYGRTNSDDFSASDVVSDIADVSGFDKSVTSNGFKVLPLDWTDEHTALLDYVAELTDWRWLAYGPTIEFGPWARTWVSYLRTESLSEDLLPARLYNRVGVPFRTFAGRRRIAYATPNTDLLPGQTVTFLADELEQPQADDTVAKQVAATLAEFYGSRRVEGRVSLGRIRDIGRGLERSPYFIRPGDLLDLPDVGYPPQRVEAVSYGPNERVSVDIGADFIARFDLPEQRQKRKRRRRR